MATARDIANSQLGDATSVASKALLEGYGLRGTHTATTPQNAIATDEGMIVFTAPLDFDVMVNVRMSASAAVTANASHYKTITLTSYPQATGTLSSSLGTLATSSVGFSARIPRSFLSAPVQLTAGSSLNIAAVTTGNGVALPSCAVIVDWEKV